MGLQSDKATYPSEVDMYEITVELCVLTLIIGLILGGMVTGHFAYAKGQKDAAEAWLKDRHFIWIAPTEEEK